MATSECITPSTLDQMSLHGDTAMCTLPPADVQSSYDIVYQDVLDVNKMANTDIRNICCIGAGYVGGPTAAVIALHHPHIRVTVIDRDQRRINAWKGRHIPIHEPGLANIVRLARDGSMAPTWVGSNCSEYGQFLQAGRSPNLFFSTACAQSVAEADMILISVNTPTKLHGRGAGRATDMTAVEGAARDIAMHAKPGAIVVEKSTVPCRTGELIKSILANLRPGVNFPILSNPEFLSEGTAIRDLQHPDRVLIGSQPGGQHSEQAVAALVNVYAAWVPRSRIATVNIWSAELSKLAANAMLAQRISSINSISAICERTGADVNEIASSLGMDTRIGAQFLKAGVGFGGSCFRKDIASLTYLAESLGLPEVAAYWQQVLTLNDFQRERFANQVISSLNNTLRGKKITVLGFAFKKNTGDTRESPALDVIRILLDERPQCISIYDPLCSEADIRHELRSLERQGLNASSADTVEISSSPYDACEGSHAILILTEWDMFKATSSPTMPPVSTTETVPSATPTALLNLRQKFQTPAIPMSTLPTPPGTPIISSLSSDFADLLLTEPPCPHDCQDCIVSQESGGQTAEDLMMPLDWAFVSRQVKEPWLFDGRGILDTQIMTRLGFRLVSIGRSSFC